MTRHRVLIVDDHRIVRAGLRALLERSPEVEVVGEAADGAAGLDAIIELKPEIVLMDISMPVMSGIEAIRRATRLLPRPRILVLSMHSEHELVRQAVSAGADGYLLKSSSGEELRLAIVAVARGETWFSPSIAHGISKDLPSSPSLALTPRQREVLQQIAEGQSTRQIARRLRISVKTVEAHRAQIMDRLGIRSLAGLVRYAVRTGLVTE